MIQYRLGNYDSVILTEEEVFNETLSDFFLFASSYGNDICK